MNLRKNDLNTQTLRLTSLGVSLKNASKLEILTENPHVILLGTNPTNLSEPSGIKYKSLLKIRPPQSNHIRNKFTHQKLQNHRYKLGTKVDIQYIIFAR